MKLSDDKLQKLKLLQEQGGFWYITKQNLVFRDLCFMAKILESWNDDQTQSYEIFFNAHKTLPEYGGFDVLVAHRATKNCEYLGLLYTPGNGKYSATNLTPFYYALKQLCDGDFNRLSHYPKLVDKQLERMFVDSSSNVIYNVSFKINPFMFLFKILLLIGDITKRYQISIQEFKLFVATSQSWNDYFEVVESILRYRSDKVYQNQCDANKSKVADVRMNILAQNHSQLEISGSDISIKNGFVKDVRKKVAEYELKDKVESTDDVNNADIIAANQPLQQIFYGAPGTGKSHEIEQLTNGSMVFRTTFHPDSDYSTFVGAYKPIMREVPMTTVIGTKVVPVEDKEGNPLYESKIQYEFVPQAFAQAYVEAWKDLDTPIYLVIEEINRGNCAQIFGDIFQLLDRKKSGFSNYYIVPDEDLRQYIVKAFKDGIDKKAFDIIKTGKNLCLPPNLYIWATMNTSDQSLFPIDSAFKRRWDWQYIPIENAELGWKINVNGNHYDWWEFLQAINKEVFTLTLSEDKQLGYFFVQAKDNIIDAKVLVNKVFFYLWNDVFKDFDMDNSKVFRQAEGQNSICFKDFYASVGEIKEDIAEQILINLGLEKEA